MGMPFFGGGYGFGFGMPFFGGGGIILNLVSRIGWLVGWSGRLEARGPALTPSPAPRTRRSS
jgi:hypothetical protein